MTQLAIPCVLMRGGTSKGPYFKAEDLPTDPEARDKLLLRIMGSPDIRQIDGIGGATTVTSKVAIVSVSEHPDADIDYLFAQVDIEKEVVDTAPTCGNMLAGVGPFAIEEGMFPATDGTTQLRIRNINTESFIEAVIQTPSETVTYEGDCAIDGVPGTAAPIKLNFFNITGSKTGKLLPTGNVRDDIDGIEVTCIDVAMPMVIANAKSFGKTGYETQAELESDKTFMERLEHTRRTAALKMGMGDVKNSVVPKIALVAAPQGTGHFTSRYFTPLSLHQSYAVSGSICASSCAALPNSVIADVLRQDDAFPELCRIEHPSGFIDVAMHVRVTGEELEVISGGAIRTARRLFAGVVYVPKGVID